MSRTERLLELLIRVQDSPRFTVAEMAAQFGVSRRTMLRDLQALSAMGVPLMATPGPHGGYQIISQGRRLPLSLTTDEALGMILSYEAWLAYADSPFSAESLSAITKLRAALPPELVRRLDQLRDHVAVVQRAPSYRAPLLPDLLHACLDRVWLDAVYESRSGVSRRRIFPFGLFAEHGFWYCACYDASRQYMVALRADRFQMFVRVEQTPPISIPSLRVWLAGRYTGGTDLLPFRARVTRRGVTNFDLVVLLGPVTVDERGEGLVEAEIPAAELDFYARHLLPLGTELVVESPPELIELMRIRTREIAALYSV